MSKRRKTKAIRITEKDFMLANRRAARMEEIALHGKPVSARMLNFLVRCASGATLCGN